MTTIWQRKLKRDLQLRSLIYLEGNIHDVVPVSQHCESYLTLEQYLIHLCEEDAQFDDVVLWDQEAGGRVYNVSSDTWERIQSVTCFSIEESPENDTFADFEEDTEGPIACCAQDFFAILSHHLQNDSGRRRAFIIDLSQTLFGSAVNSTELERQWSHALIKGIRNRGLGTRSNWVSSSQNVAVFITSKGTLPTMIAQGQSEVSTIAIPKPNRQDRLQFIQKNQAYFRVKDLMESSRVLQDFVDGTDQATLRELGQMMKLSQLEETTGRPLSVEALIHLFRHGEKESPWENLNREKLQSIKEQLELRVKGQDFAIQKVSRVVKRAFTGLSGVQHSSKQQRPKGVLFFVGPTGVGKTELAKSLAQFLFGEEEACIRFDMSEYNHEHSDQRLVGAPPGYVGFEEGGQLTNLIKERPFSVLLFDEIEKAHPRILDKFLQILEDGRLTDGQGNTVYFSDSIIIFTSNIGASTIEQGTEAETQRSFIREVKKHFTHELGRPELLNRIGDNIVPFNFISDPEFMEKIVELKLKPIEKIMKEKYGIEIVYIEKEKLVDRIIARTDTKNGGRGIANTIETLVVDELSEFLFGIETHKYTSEIWVLCLEQKPIEFRFVKG